jgi:hypothetical protein
MANKQRLLHFLDQHVFNPILNASPKNSSEADDRKLKDVQDRTRSEQARFHHYSSARDIVDNYKSDLHSKTAHRVNRELEALNLPTLPSVKDEFLKLAGEGQSSRWCLGAKLAENLAAYAWEASWDPLNAEAKDKLKDHCSILSVCALGALNAAPIQAIRTEKGPYLSCGNCSPIGGGSTTPERAVFL